MDAKLFTQSQVDIFEGTAEFNELLEEASQL
jgi:hypothetical protein